MKTIKKLFTRSDFKTKMEGSVLKGKQMTGENFINADLTNANLNGADLSGLNLTGAILSGAKLNNAKLIGTILANAILIDTELNDANLTDANLTDANLQRAEMSRVKLNGANLSGTDLTNTILVDAKLQSLDSHKTIFNKTILTQTILYGANLSNNDLRDVDLSDTLFVNNEFPSDKRVQLSYVNLRGSDLQDLDLRGAILTGSRLEGVNLTNARLHSVDLTKANLIGANLTNVDLSKAIAREVNLRNANLTNADLTNANFASANLRDANLTNVILKNTIFLSANLEGTSLTLKQIAKSKSKIKNAKMSRTEMSISQYNQPSYTRTKKMVRVFNNKTPRSRNSLKSKKCITILIVAHGDVFPNTNIGSNLLDNVHISQMAGGIDINGLFGGIIKPIKPIINKYDDNIVYNISTNRATADASIDLMYQTYPYLLERYNLLKEKNCSKAFYSIFQDIVYYIKKFYADAGYTDFPTRSDYELYGKDYKKRRESFRIFNSYQEKSFSFIPNPYEFCMTRTINGCKKLAPERARQLTYGITMLQSSDPEDQPYTLAGISLENGDYKNAILSNWKQDVVRDYWRQKIESRRSINREKTDEYLHLYTLISTPLDPEGLYIDPDDSKTSILLSNLLTLLKNGMGFTNINIIDYSCNECETSISHFKRAAIDVKNSVPELEEYRAVRTSVRNRPRGVKEWNTIINPQFSKIVDVIGKANTGERRKKGKTIRIKRQTVGGAKGGKRKRKFI
jgi:uncharacterized protein YjbI with pentapeptide repeats